MLDDDILRSALLIANDVIPFVSHRVYMRWPGEHRKEGVWHFRTGFVERSNLPRDDVKRLKHYRNLQRKLIRSGRPTLEVPSSHGSTCLARLRLRDGATGYVAIRREDRFSEVERFHIRLVAQLIQAAFSNDEVAKLLRRLYVVFIDGRTLMQASTPKEILRRYLRKSEFVCHPKIVGSMFSTRPTILGWHTNSDFLR